MSSINERIIKDIMIPVNDYLSVNAGTTLPEAAAVLKKSFCPNGGEPCNGHPNILVYDNNVLVGTLGFEDIFKAIEPQYLKGGTYKGWSVDATWSLPVFWEGLFTDRCQEAMDKKVTDFFRPCEFSLHPEDPLIKAVYGMAKYNVNILPVMENEKVKGMVRSSEIFQEICSLMLGEGAKVYQMGKTPVINKDSKVNVSSY